MENKLLLTLIISFMSFVLGIATGVNWVKKTEIKPFVMPPPPEKDKINPVKPKDPKQFEFVNLVDKDGVFIEQVALRRPTDGVLVLKYKMQIYIYIGGAYKLTSAQRAFSII